MMTDNGAMRKRDLIWLAYFAVSAMLFGKV